MPCSRKWCGCVLALALVGCSHRTSQKNIDGGSPLEDSDAGDAGQTNSSDGGGPVPDPDGGVVSNLQDCPIDAAPPSAEEGGLRWQPSYEVATATPQSGGWTVFSTSDDCAGLTPSSVPARREWVPDAGLAACAAAISDGQGNLTVDWGDGAGALNSFLPVDGSQAVDVRNGTPGALHKENQIWAAPLNTGFALMSSTLNPWCTYLRPLSPTAVAASVTTLSNSPPDQVKQIVANPTGGFVVLRLTVSGSPALQTADVRFLDAGLQPLGDWHTVTTYHRPGEDNYLSENFTFSLNVDQLGRALVLTLAFPPSFGAPPPVSEWKFSARWMGADGPLTDEFQPITPTFVPNNGGAPLFAFWGTILPLKEGGFAAYHNEADSEANGTITPTGWYGYYPSGEASHSAAPAWLAAFDGSLTFLTGGAYAALKYNDPESCSRAISIIGSKGTICSSLEVEDTAECTSFPDVVSSDGSLILQDEVNPKNSCLVRWWPRLAHVSP